MNEKRMIGNEIYSFAEKLWPLNRSITGEGVRQTLSIIRNDYLPELIIKEVSTGQKVFDWEVPKEWKINDAYIIDPSGKKICDFKLNNLHLVNYSSPVEIEMTLSELNEHLYSLPDQPNAIPYITSYYCERWGFCLKHEDRVLLKDGIYKVFIDSELFNGVLNYGELFIKGATDKEIFISTYVCHPSMANNELSGPTVTTFLAKWINSLKKREYSYRIIFIPETIGSITYLSKNLKELKRKVVAGYNISCVGDNRCYSYIPSRLGNTISDIVAKHVLKWVDPSYISYTWSDRGSDERQYCAPGIDLPIASVIRTKYGAYKEYHTSLDTLGNVVTPEGLQGGYNVLKLCLEAIENNFYPEATVLGEPQLGRRGLYSTLGTKNIEKQSKLIIDVLTWSDRNHSLIEIAENCKVPIWELYPIILILKEHSLIN